MFKFKLVAGSHVQRDKDGNQQHFKAGVKGKDIVESDVRLDQKFGADKFVPLGSPFADPVHRPNQTSPVSSEAVTPPQDFNKMSEEQLRKFAAEEGIDLKGIKKGDVTGLRKALQEYGE